MTAETKPAIQVKWLLIAFGVVLVAGASYFVYSWRQSTTSVVPGFSDFLQTPDGQVTEPNGPQIITDEGSPRGLRGFDIVRVDAEGHAVVAGHAEPNSTIQLTLDGVPIEKVETDASGNFVALLDIPIQMSGALAMTGEGEDGVPVGDGVQTVLIAPPSMRASDSTSEETTLSQAGVLSDQTTGVAPQVLLADDTGIAVLQDGNDYPAVENIVIDAITYDPGGDVALSGRGQGGANLRIYLDNTPIDTASISESGQWRLPLSDVDSGIYTLRVDELAADGTVTSRTETPFKREEPTQLAAVQERVESPQKRVEAVTVQPGSTLWAIARDHLGGGPLYVRVFELNKDQIRDPDMIYPGQVFEIPNTN